MTEGPDKNSDRDHSYIMQGGVQTALPKTVRVREAARMFNDAPHQEWYGSTELQVLTIFTSALTGSDITFIYGNGHLRN
jgi:hypothetical protein